MPAPDPTPAQGPQPLWKQLIHHDKLEAQYDVLLKRGTFTDKEIALHLARFAEANIFVPADDAVDAAHKVVAEVRAELIEKQKYILELEATKVEQEWEVVPNNTSVYAANGALWIVCDDEEIAILYPDIGTRAPLPEGWQLRRTTHAPAAESEGGE